MSSTKCGDSTDFEKIQNKERDSELKGSRHNPLLIGGFYRNSAEHLQEELASIGTLIRLFLEKTRSEAGKDRQDFPGTFILEAEANSILEAVCAILKPARHKD